MSPWNDRRRSMWLLYTGLVFIVVAAVLGYLALTGVVGDYDDDDGGGGSGVSPSLSTPTTDGDPDPRPAVLEVVTWGRSSGQLAVVVRNNSGRHLDRARLRITARNSDGDVVLKSSGTPRDVCCTVVGLPPGGEFGLFAELNAGVGPIAAVEVASLEVGGRQPGSEPRVSVRNTGLQRYDDDTVVTAELTARGWLSGYVAVQAILTDADGEVAQVISGRFYCFERGTPREVRLHLFHGVPRSLRLDRVVAFPIPIGVRPHVPGKCR